jgi:hypothetical protein
MPWIRRATAIVTALAALAALATAPEATTESLEVPQVSDARQDGRGADATERGQNVQRADRSGAERGER